MFIWTVYRRLELDGTKAFIPASVPDLWSTILISTFWPYIGTFFKLYSYSVFIYSCKDRAEASMRAWNIQSNIVINSVRGGRLVVCWRLDFEDL